jgi:hypothetical protein
MNLTDPSEFTLLVRGIERASPSYRHGLPGDSSGRRPMSRAMRRFEVG